MKQTKRIPMLLIILSAAASLLFTASRTVLSLVFLDAEYGVYEHGAILPQIFSGVLLAVTILLGIFSLLHAPKRQADFKIPVNDATIFICCLCAFLLAADAILTIYNIATSGAPSIFEIIELVAAVPAVLFFFGTIKKDAKPIPLTFASFFPIAWCSICLIRVYFDNTLLHTSPIKIFSELAFLAAMVYFLMESRILLQIVKCKIHFAVSLIAPIFLLTSSVPNIILADKMMRAESDSYIRTILIAVFALFIYVRTVMYVLAPDKTASDTDVPPAEPTQE